MVYIMLKFFKKGRSLYQKLLFPYTPASIKKKFIFVHIPKAAGTSVRVALGEPKIGRQHLPWWIYQQASPKRFDEYYKFAFVRDPLERALSGYKYLKSGGNKSGDLIVSQYLKRYKSFNDFVECELLNGNMIYHPIFRPQSWYLCDWNGDIRVDYIGRFENLENDFNHIMKNMGLKQSGLPNINKSNGSDEVVSNYSKVLIKKIYKDDYILFDY